MDGVEITTHSDVCYYLYFAYNNQINGLKVKCNMHLKSDLKKFLPKYKNNIFVDVKIYGPAGII